MTRVRLTALALALLALAPACARDEDCNGGASCGRIRLCVVEVDDGQQRGVGSDPEPSGEQVERDARWGVLWAVACVGPPGTQAGRGNGEHEE